MPADRDFTSHLDQETRHALRSQVSRKPIDGVALGDTAQIERQSQLRLG